MLRASWLAVGFSVFSTIGLVAADPTPVPLDVAVKTGLVEVQVQGRGVCSGDAVRVEVRRKADRPVHVIVEPGTVVESTSGKVQSMVCHGVKYQQAGDKYRRVNVMVLNDNAPRTFLLEAFCRDFAKPTPGAGSSFRLGTTDRPATRVIAKGKEAGASLKAIQVAVWLQKGVSEEDVRRRFRATEAEVKTAGVLVQAATAAEQGDAAAEGKAEQSVRVLVNELFNELRKRRRELAYVHGDTVEVTVDSAPIRTGPRTIGTAEKGKTFQVLAVDQDGVRVEFEPGEGKPSRRGWLALEHVRLAEGTPRGEGRPLLRKVGELVTEADLEVITASERGH